MEDSKLQALHDALSQLRGQKGLGTNSHYSWQRGASVPTTRHPAAAKLPNNALYAHFLPEGVYDPEAARKNDGDGRVVKRDFSDAIVGDGGNSLANVSRTSEGSTEKAQRKALRKAAKKEAKKAAKLKAKLEEKKRQKKLAKKLLKTQSSGVSEITLSGASIKEEQEMVVSCPTTAKTDDMDESGSKRKRGKLKKDKSRSKKEEIKRQENSW